MNRRDFIKLLGLTGISALIPKGFLVLTYTELMMKMANGEKLDSLEKEQLRQYTSEIDNNRQIVSAWQQVNKKIKESYLDLPIATIYSNTLSYSVSSITIQIPPDYRHLMMFCAVVTDRNNISDYIHGRFNGDTGTNYAEFYLDGATSGQQTNRDDFGISICTAALATSGANGTSNLFIPHYNSTVWKSVINNYGYFDGTDMVRIDTFAQWKNTSPVRSLTIFSENSANIVSGSAITLLGIK